MSQTKYSQVMEYLQGLIISGEAYDSIPSERAISATLHISRMTVRKAVEDLCDRGILYRDGHRGTFIAHKASNLANAPDVSEKYRILFLDATYDSRQVDDIRQSLGLQEHERIFRLVRMAMDEEIPLRIEEIYLAADDVSDEQVGRLESFLNLKRYRERGIVHSALIPELIPGKYARLMQISRLLR